MFKKFFEVLEYLKLHFSVGGTRNICGYFILLIYLLI